MNDIKLQKFAPINPLLSRIVKYYWIIRSDKNTQIRGKLIPTNNMDMIIHLSSPIKYTMGTNDLIFKKSHFNGIQHQSRIITQSGPLETVGISFYPTGLYPFVKTPLAEFKNSIVQTDLVVGGLESDFAKISNIASDTQKIPAIEKTLMNVIDYTLLPESWFDLAIQDFQKHAESLNIGAYCQSCGINPKTLERNFHKYIGTTPKAFLQITKFQRTLKRLKSKDIDSMTQLGYEFNDYDQTHFINSFKSFAGNTPLQQAKKNDLILDILPPR